jgi:ubiquinone/menaquinone biosynthesis C-methylase UbiE
MSGQRREVDCLANGFRNVDEQATFEKFRTCLTFMDGLPSFQSYKAETMRRLSLRPGHRVLDVGCGLGFDVDRVAESVGPQGEAVGLDLSQSFVDAATSRNSARSSRARFVVGDAHQMAFDDESFDACRVDRSLQHLENPQRVVSEMCRVLRRGGRIVCAEPDWGTFTIASPDRPKVRRIVEVWSDRFRHGWIGRELFGLLHAIGLADIEITGHLLVAEGFSAVDTVFDVRRTAEVLAETDDAQQYRDWLAGLLASDARCPVIATVTLFLVSGRKS